MRTLSTALLYSSSLLCGAQSVSPSVVASAGGSASASGFSFAWTVGEVMTETYASGSIVLSQGFHQGGVVRVRVSISSLLEGPFNSAMGLMHDSLRTKGLLPLIEPYTTLGYTHVGGGGETTTAAVLTITGSDAIVDWLFLELRSSSDNTVVVATRSALVQRDGDVVDTDGLAAVAFPAPAGSYYVAVHHRNHLGVMTLATVALSATATVLDLTDGSVATFGTDAQKLTGTTRTAWSGDVEDDGVVKYTGEDNDRDPILLEIGGVVPTATSTGYLGEDVNMDGTVKYTGADNDRDPILQNIGGVVPTSTKSEQIP